MLNTMNQTVDLLSPLQQNTIFIMAGIGNPMSQKMQDLARRLHKSDILNNEASLQVE